MKRSQTPSRRDLLRGLRGSSGQGESSAPNWLGGTGPVRSPADETLREPLPDQPMTVDAEPYDLPPVRQAILNDEALAALFCDLENSASDVQLNRGGPSQNPLGKQPTADQLRAAHQALREGSLNRLQIRYRWEGALWIDTLQRVDREYRLIRVAHP